MKTAEEVALFLDQMPEDELRMVEQLQREAERKGAEEMREKCAEDVERRYSKNLGKQIRALPLPGDES